MTREKAVLYETATVAVRCSIASVGKIVRVEFSRESGGLCWFNVTSEHGTALLPHTSLTRFVL